MGLNRQPSNGQKLINRQPSKGDNFAVNRQMSKLANISFLARKIFF